MVKIAPHLDRFAGTDFDQERPRNHRRTTLSVSQHNSFANDFSLFSIKARTLPRARVCAAHVHHDYDFAFSRQIVPIGELNDELHFTVY